MKILVADKFERSGLDGLKERGFEVDYRPDLKEDALREAIELDRPEGLIVRSTRVNAEMMLSSIRLIVRAGAGYNTIDTNAAKERGIQVANCPGKNARAVAELAFGLILALDRRIPDNVFELREGRWNKKEFAKAKGLHCRTLGLIGLGNIGRIMVELGRAFGMHVIAQSHHLSAEAAESLAVELVHHPEELARRCDVISVHCSLNDDTCGMLDADFFQAMQPGAYFVNTARAEIIDQDALLSAIEKKDIRAGLDVFEDEPATPTGEYSGPLKNNPNVYCTHHIGASTDEAQEAVAMETVRIFEVFRDTQLAPNLVNA